MSAVAKYVQVFTNKRIAVTLLFGFASGLPLPLVTGTLDAWMASEKVDLKLIGIFSLVGLPYTVKYLWAPLLDRYPAPFLNRRTGWIAITQVLLMLTLAVMGYCDPKTNPAMLAVIAFVAAFLSASQDIVIDAYRTEVLERNELGAGAAVVVLGARLALLTSGAVALILSDHLPWSTVYLIMAGLLGIGLITSLFAPEPRIVAKPPQSLKDAVILPFVNYFKRDGAILMLLFIIFYKLGDAVAGKMTTPFLIQIGFTKTDIGTVNKGFGMIVTIVGALFGGAMISRLGIWRSLWIFGILQAVSNLIFVALAQAGMNYPLMITCIGVENICGGMGTAAFVAFLMSLTDRDYSATQYALLTSVMAITRTFAGTFTGFLAEGVGWTWFFIISTFCALPGLLIMMAFKDKATSATATTA